MQRSIRGIAAIFLLLICSGVHAAEIWKIGLKNYSSADLALGPSDYKNFLSKDFGFEDRYYLIGKSIPKNDFPYVLPGPSDTWGGTWGTSGWRTHEVNILFGIKKIPTNGNWKLIVDLVDSNPDKSLVKVIINKQQNKFLLKGKSKGSLTGQGPANPLSGFWKSPINQGTLNNGGNCVTITILEGSWIVFDDIRLEGTDGIELTEDKEVFVRNVEPANYELTEKNKRIQPLLVDVEHLTGHPLLEVSLDGRSLYSAHLDTGRYQLEVPMPAVTKPVNSKYQLLVNGKEIESGTIQRTPRHLQSLADYVDTRIGTAHSRWMIAPGPWMPFSMVKLSPDNQNMGWQAGYQPTFETIGCFSHIHEWTMAGLGMMPTNGDLKIKVGDQFDPDSGYRSPN